MDFDNIPWWLLPAGACILPNLGGYVGSLFVNKTLDTWYKDLKKAPWNPPNSAFGIVWTILYTGMGFASYLVWKEGGGFNDATLIPFILYAVQLLINWAWSPLFFGWKLIKWALIDIVLLDVTVAGCAVSFSWVSPLAATLFIPYMAWLCLATTLMIYIYIHNPEHHKHHKKHHPQKEHSK